MNRPLYHIPVLSRPDFGIVRAPGPGLGNLLFPVSRALIGQKKHGGIFVYPTLRQIKFGPLLRGERDLRTYGALMRSRKLAEWHDWIAASAATAHEEATSADAKEGAIKYAGLGRYFHDLVGERQLIGKWLTANMRPRGLVEGAYDIAIHVRLGDFLDAGTKGDGHVVRQPMEWYRNAHALACDKLGIANPVTLLFTDENPSRVAANLGIPGIGAEPGRNALTSIVNLSKARFVITSRSTFSMWGVYLGDMPAVWNARLNLAKSFPVRPERDFIL